MYDHTHTGVSNHLYKIDGNGGYYIKENEPNKSISTTFLLSFVKVTPTVLKIKTRETRRRHKIQEGNRNRVNLESIHNDAQTV